MNFIEEGRDKILVKWDNNVVISPYVNTEGAVYDKRRGTINAGVLSTLLKNISEDSMLSFESTDNGVSVTIRKYRPVNKDDENVIESKKREYQETLRKQIEETEAKYRYALKLIEIGKKTFVKIFDNLIIETERRYNGTVIYFPKETILNQRYDLSDFSELNFLNLICHLKEEYENRELLESNDKKEKVKKKDIEYFRGFDNMIPTESYTINNIKKNLTNKYSTAKFIYNKDESVTRIVDEKEMYNLPGTELKQEKYKGKSTLDQRYKQSIPEDVESFNKELKKTFEKENTLLDRRKLYEQLKNSEIFEVSERVRAENTAEEIKKKFTNNFVPNTYPLTEGYFISNWIKNQKTYIESEKNKSSKYK